MTVANEPAGYTVTQILLHWAIAALIILQLVLGDAEHKVFDPPVVSKKISVTVY